MKVNRFFYKAYFSVPKRVKVKVLAFIIKREGGQMYSGTLRAIYETLGRSIGYGSYGGCFSLSNVPKGVIFGNYCSIAPNIRIFRANHPKGHFTSHPLLYNPIAGFVKTDQLERPQLIIGNDVWIGEWTVILPSVTYIGNGAMIGAGSIVTKNVEPYTVVAGNPAKVITTRFDEETIKNLENTQWWNLEKDALTMKIGMLESIVSRS